MKVFSNGLAMRTEWRMIGLANMVYVEECAGSHSVGSLCEEVN